MPPARPSTCPCAGTGTGGSSYESSSGLSPSARLLAAGSGAEVLELDGDAQPRHEDVPPPRLHIAAEDRESALELRDRHRLDGADPLENIIWSLHCRGSVPATSAAATTVADRVQVLAGSHPGAGGAHVPVSLLRRAMSTRIPRRERPWMRHPPGGDEPPTLLGEPSAGERQLQPGLQCRRHGRRPALVAEHRRRLGEQ